MNPLHKSIFEESPEIKLVVDCKNFKIISANKAARKYFKFLKPEKKEQFLTDLLYEKKSQKLKKLLSKNSSVLKSIQLDNKKNKPADFKVYAIRIKLKNKCVAECTLTKNSSTKSIPKTQNDPQVTESKLKTIFDNNPLMIFILDKAGIIKEVNSLGAKELGYEIKELVDQPVMQVFHKEDWLTVKNQIADCLNNPNKIFTWEIRKVKKTGETIWVRENASSINSNGNGPNVLILCENITRIKEAEELINDSSMKIKQIVNASPYGVHVYDLKDDGRLIFTDFNSAADRILGMNHSQLLNKEILDAFPNLAQTKIPDAYKLIAKNGTKLENEIIEYEDQNLKGAFEVSAFQISPNKIAAFFSDITEKRKAFDKLEKSELKFKSLFELANDSIFLMDEEIFIDCNQKTLDLFGCNKSDIIGKPPYEFSPPFQPDGRHSDEKALEKISEAMKGNPQRFEWKHKKLNGDLFDAEVSLNKIFLGDVVLIQAIVRDISERKKSEEQISMLAHAVKSISESVCITDTDGKIIFVNNSFCTSYGYMYDEIIGKDISLMYSENTPVNLLRKIIPATLKSGWSGELISKRKDGSEFPTSVSTSVIRDENDNPVAFTLIALDITDRKRSENELRNSKQMLQLILDNIPQRIFWKDLDSRYLGCNKNFANDAGVINPTDLVGFSDYDMPWKSAEADYYRSVDKEVMKKDEPIYKIIEPQTHHDGEVAWLETNKVPLHDECGNVVGILGTYEDITERKKSEEALKESEERFRSLIDNMIEAALIIDWDGEIIFANNSAAKLVHLEDTAHGIGKKVFEFLHPDFKPQVYAALRRLERNPAPFKDEYIIKTVHNEELWVESLGINIIFSNKKYILVTLRDITSRKNAEKQLLEAKEKAEELSRVKSNFLANMSHELRTPLVGILGFAELLQEKLRDDHTKEMAERILTSANRLMDTLNLLLDLSRIEAKKVDINMQPNRISELVESQVQLFEAVAERKNLFLETEIINHNLYSNVDEQIFRQIINNLVNNALKYTYTGGVMVSVDMLVEDSREFARISVKDTGIGIPAESLGLIFQEFRQVSEGFNRHFEGTGLGLTITKNFVELMDGQISVKSTVGSGSMFTIIFPLLKDYKQIEVKKVKESDKEKISEKEYRAGFRPKLLVVDNDESSRDIIKLFLKNICETDFADSGEKAFRQINEKKV
ncbi:MAG: PAS domain S-box protein [bacterium]|nr:PAS domain S-box protein [bacterium]